MRRFNAQILTSQDTDALVAARLAWILEFAEPSCVIVFGSASRYEMREDSDIDLVVIVPDGVDVRAVSARVLGRKPPHDVPADILFIDESGFLERSRVGGVHFLAKTEGRVIHGRLPHEVASK